MQIRPVGAELFHADQQKERQTNKTSNRFPQFCERAKKNVIPVAFRLKWKISNALHISPVF